MINIIYYLKAKIKISKLNFNYRKLMVDGNKYQNLIEAPLLVQ